MAGPAGLDHDRGMNDETSNQTTPPPPTSPGDAAAPEATAEPAGGPPAGGAAGGPPAGDAAGGPAGPTPPAPSDPLSRGFDALRSMGLRRDTTRSWIGGVCAGIAQRLSIDPVIVRAGFVVMGLFGGVGVLVYLLAWVLLPDQGGRIVAERALRHGDAGSILLLAAAAFATFVVFGLAPSGGGRWGLGWVIVILGGIFLLTRRGPSRVADPGLAPPYGGPVPSSGASTDPSTAGGTGPYAASSAAWYATSTSYAPAGTASVYAPPASGPATPLGGYATPSSGYAPPPGSYATTSTYAYAPQPPARPRRRWLGWAGFLLVSGLAIAAYGLGRALDGPLGLPGNGAQLGRVLALVVIGIGLVVAGLTGRKGGLLSFVGVLLAMVVGLHAMVPGIAVSPNAGDQSWVPTSTTTSTDYGLGVGSAVLDLRDLPTDPSGTVTVSGQVGVGDLTVLVPADLTAEITTEVGAGYLGVQDLGDSSTGIQETSGGPISRVTTFGSGQTDVRVKVDVGLGSVRLERQPAS